MRSKPKDAQRLNLELPKRIVDKIENLRIKTGATSTTQTIKEAILTYDVIINNMCSGGTLLTKDCDGNTNRLNLIIDVDNKHAKT